jgi:hypothetical protein
LDCDVCKVPSIRNSDIEFAALRQQVSSLESDYRDLKAVVVGLDKKIDTSFKSLAEKIDRGQKTPWVAIWTAAGVIVSTLTFVGYLAMQPLQGTQSDLRNDLQEETNKRIQEDQLQRDALAALSRYLNQRINVVGEKAAFLEGFLMGKMSYVPYNSKSPEYPAPGLVPQPAR